MSNLLVNSLKKFVQLIEENLRADQILNADETFIFFNVTEYNTASKL